MTDTPRLLTMTAERLQQLNRQTTEGWTSFTATEVADLCAEVLAQAARVQTLEQELANGTRHGEKERPWTCPNCGNINGPGQFVCSGPLCYYHRRIE